MGKKKEEVVETFKEHAEMSDLLIEEVREKLGDEAAVVSDVLVNLQQTIVKAGEVHEATVEEKERVESRNQELLEVNNNLFIKNSNRPDVDVEDKNDLGGIDPTAAYVNAKIKKS